MQVVLIIFNLYVLYQFHIKFKLQYISKISFKIILSVCEITIFGHDGKPNHNYQNYNVKN